jgi:hypothetical protein
MRHFIKQLFLIPVAVIAFHANVLAADKETKILVIGVDGIINTAIDYASTPGIDDLIENATYNMNSYGGLPAYSSTGWATLLTGVSADKNGVATNGSFSGNNFTAYLPLVSRIKSNKSSVVVASVVRNADINNYLNADADYKYNYSSDDEVEQKTAELLKQDDVDVVFAQFSSPEEVGKSGGYQLRDASYVIAIQQIDSYVAALSEAIESRSNYSNENWSIYFVSTHGGTESGEQPNTTQEEIDVPMILSGSDFDDKEMDAASQDPISGADNTLTINKESSGDYTYVRIPIAGTALQGMDKFTIEMWIKPGTDNSSDPSIIGDKNWDSGGNPGFTICRSGTAWKINIANQSGTRYDIKGGTIEDESWHHIAVSFDKTNQCDIYQDGELVNESKLSYVSADNMASPYNYLCLAQDGTQTYSGGSPNWSGTFNEVRVWTDVLPSETIKKYMNQRNIESSTHPYLSSLNLYLKMDEVSGTTVKDYSGQGNNGELVGTATERHPYYPLSLTDVAANVLNQLGIGIDSAWGLDGTVLKANVPYRLFKVN